jgi:hypothetical protein
MTDPATRSTHRPSPDFSSRPIVRMQLAAGTWTRAFNRPDDPIFFSKRKGNRFTPSDGRYSVCYLGDGTRTCFLETFGDELYSARSRLARARWLSKVVVRLRFPEIFVCDLTDENVLTSMGVDKGSLYANDVAIPQAWAKAIMNHPAGFQGILYASRFAGRCLAAFDVPGLASHIRELQRFDLNGSSDGDKLVLEFDIVLI